MSSSTPRTIITLRHLLLALSTLALAAPASQSLASPMDWIMGQKVQGNGNIKKQTRELGHFSGLSMGIDGKLELKLGNTESITIETDDNLLPLIEAVIEHGTLKIRTVKRNMNLDTRNLRIVVQAKDIDHVTLAGSGAIEAASLHAPKLKFDLGGSGSINVKSMDSESVSIAIGGSGNFKGAGNAGELSVSIGGSGDVQAGKLKANSASVSVAGSGQATIWARDSISATIAGSGDINYYGDPKVSTSIVGSGSTKRLGAAP